MRRRITLTLATLLALGLMAGPAATKPPSGPGHVTVGADASVWDSSVEQDDDAGIFPVGGSGQINGEFVLAERYGIQIGLRAQERFEGPLEATPAEGNKVGVYEANTGFSSGTRGTWNFDWHVDLRTAEGVAAGTTLADYDLALEYDFADDIFGLGNPADLAFVGDNAVLFQGSWNPDFGNDQYDPTVARTYELRLVLTPESFNGPPLAAKIRVDVTD